MRITGADGRVLGIDQRPQDGRLYGVTHLGLWFEVGSPEMIAPTEEALLRA